MLIQLHVNGEDSIQASAKTIRAWLEANGAPRVPPASDRRPRWLTFPSLT